MNITILHDITDITSMLLLQMETGAASTVIQAHPSRTYPPNLHLPLELSILAELQGLGCTSEAAISLEAVFRGADERMREATQVAYHEVMGNVTGRSSKVYDMYVGGVSVRLRKEYEAKMQILRTSIIEDVVKARTEDQIAIHRSPSTESPDTHMKSGTKLSEHQVARLDAVFSEQQNVSKAEKELLALELDLTERQVACWFANRRARRDASPRKRHHPYAAARHPSSSPRKAPSSRSISSSSVDSIISYDSPMSDISVSDAPSPAVSDDSPAPAFSLPSSTSSWLAELPLHHPSPFFDVQTSSNDSFLMPTTSEDVEVDWLTQAGFHHDPNALSGAVVTHPAWEWVLPGSRTQESIVFPLPSLEMSL